MNIIFFYPSRIVGGAEYLFARMAHYLNKKGHKCFIVDYEDGIYRKLNPQFDKNNYINFNLPPNLPLEEYYLVTYPTEMHNILNYFSYKEPIKKVLFWGVHPDNFESLIPFRTYLPKYIRKQFSTHILYTINTLFKYEALVPMDGGVLERYRELYKLNKEKTAYKFLPIPVNVDTNLTNHDKQMKQIKKNINVCWLGRLSSEKVHSLQKVIDDLYSLKGIRIKLDIIGDGEKKNLLNVKLNCNHLRVDFLGTIIDNLDQKLLKYDLVFGMGTSVLESAKLGIPSILIDGSYDELPDNYKYKWIYETKDFVLGAFKPSVYFYNGHLSMQDIVNIMADKEEYMKTAISCKEYVFKYHAIDIVAEQLLERIESSKMALIDTVGLPINKNHINRLMKFYYYIKEKYLWIFNKMKKER